MWSRPFCVLSGVFPWKPGHPRVRSSPGSLTKSNIGYFTDKIIVPRISVTGKLFKNMDYMDSSFPCLLTKRMQETHAIQEALGLRQVEVWTICGWFAPKVPRSPARRMVLPRLECSKACHSTSSWFVKNNNYIYIYKYTKKNICV